MILTEKGSMVGKVVAQTPAESQANPTNERINQPRNKLSNLLTNQPINRPSTQPNQGHFQHLLSLLEMGSSSPSFGVKLQTTTQMEMSSLKTGDL